MLKKNYSPEPIEATAPVVAEVVTPEVTPAATPVVAAPVSTSFDADAAAKILANEGIATPEKVVAAEPVVTPPVATEDKLTEVTEDFTFETPTPPEPKDITSWKDLGSVLDFEVKEDTEEGVKAAYQAHFQAKVAEEREAAKSVTLETELQKIDPEAGMLFDFMKNGGTVELFKEPLKPFDDLVSLRDEELVRKVEQLRKTSEDEIDDKIINMVDDGTLEQEATALRQSIKEERTKFQKEIVEKRKATYEKLYSAETKTIQSALDKEEVFLGIPLKKEVKTTLSGKINTYRERFKNEPELVAKAIIALELGEQAKGLIQKKSYEEGRSKIQAKLHNLEDVPRGDQRPAGRLNGNIGDSLSEQWEAQLKAEKAK
jgi:hypothetical protein